LRDLLWLLGLGLAACADPSIDPTEEVAAELRALRLQLAAQAAAVPSTTSQAPAGPPIDGKELLQPLREVFAGLQSNQQELGARQAALAQELQRWSQLLVTSLGEKHAEEAKTMAARIAALEQSLQQQDARHREVEALLQGALERTADRLEHFLQRLPGRADEPAPGSRPNDPPTEVPAAANPGPDAKPATPAGNGERPFAARSHNASPRWWWLGITALGCSVAGFFLRRAWRLGGGRVVEPEATEVVVSPSPGLPAASTAPFADQGVEDLWATAALLGEAVERLRQQQPATGPTPTPPSPKAVESIDLEELFVIEEDGPAPVAPSQPPAAPAVQAEPAAAPGPEFTTWRLAAASIDTVLAVLHRTAFVLRRPAPTTQRVDGMIEVRFAVLPGTTAADRARLAQTLREAGR
jgi:hypothetical protein